MVPGGQVRGYSQRTFKTCVTRAPAPAAGSPTTCVCPRAIVPSLPKPHCLPRHITHCPTPLQPVQPPAVCAAHRAVLPQGLHPGAVLLLRHFLQICFVLCCVSPRYLPGGMAATSYQLTRCIFEWTPTLPTHHTASSRAPSANPPTNPCTGVHRGAVVGGAPAGRAAGVSSAEWVAAGGGDY